MVPRARIYTFIAILQSALKNKRHARAFKNNYLLRKIRPTATSGVTIMRYILRAADVSIESRGIIRGLMRGGVGTHYARTVYRVNR